MIWMDSKMLNKLTASPGQIEQAIKYGEKIEYKEDGIVLTNYFYQGHIYITAIEKVIN